MMYIYPPQKPPKNPKRLRRIFNIIAFCVVSLMLIIFYAAARRSFIRNDQLFKTYESQSQWYLQGQAVAVKLLGKGDQPTRNAFLVEIDVDTFVIKHNSLLDDSPYFGLYDKRHNKAYIITTLYSPAKNDCFKEGDSLPYIYADSKHFRIVLSHGYSPSFTIGKKKTLEALAKDTVNFIKF